MKTTMKYFLYALLSLAPFSQLSAQTEYMVVQAKDGTKTRTAVENVEKVYFSNIDPTGKLELTSAKVSGYYSPNNFTIDFGGANNTALTLDTYSSENCRITLLPGEYTIAGKSGNYIDLSYSSFSPEGTSKTMTGGTVKVEKTDANVYSIAMDITCGEETVSAFYEGMIDGCGYFKADLSSAKLISTNDDTAGLYALKVNDKDWKCEATFYLYADPASTELPVGTYTLSDTKGVNTLGVTSSVDDYKFSNRLAYNFTTGTDADKSKGTVTVSKNAEGNYVIDVDLVSGTGIVYDMNFTGTITDGRN